MLNRDVAETPLASDSNVVNRGVVHGNYAADPIETFFRHEGLISTFSVGQRYVWDIVVGHRVGESRECSHLGIGWIGSRIEANVSKRINLKDNVIKVVHGNRGVRQYGVTERCNSLLSKDLLRVF